MSGHNLAVEVMGGSEDEYVYVGHGLDCVLVCEHGDIPKWRNAFALTPDAARRLAGILTEQADAADATEPGDRP